jgi:hypothetical protein
MNTIKIVNLYNYLSDLSLISLGLLVAICVFLYFIFFKKKHKIVDMDGLIPIANTENPYRACDIVFLHGLDGGSHSTWTHQEKKNSRSFFWPKELAQDVGNCGIWTIGYAAGKTSVEKPGMLIEKRAGNVALKLVNQGLGDRPLIFVTHSMGGLILKSLLVDSEAIGDKNRKRISQSTKGIVFCGTPHRGSFYASLAVFFGRLVHVIRAQSHVEQMINGSENIDLLNDRFIEWQRKNRAAIEAYIENIPPLGKFLSKLIPIPRVVSRSSSNPGIPGYPAKDVDESHKSISKPANRSNDVYLGTLRLIKAIIPQEKSDRKNSLRNNFTEFNNASGKLPKILAERKIEAAIGSVTHKYENSSIQVVAMITSDKIGKIGDAINAWKEKLRNDPLAPSNREKIEKGKLSDFLSDPTSKGRLLEWLATEHFSGYVYFIKLENNESGLDVHTDDLAAIALEHRLMKKNEKVITVEGNCFDIERVAYTAVARTGKAQKFKIKTAASREDMLPLTEFAQLVAAASAHHLIKDENFLGTEVFNHLKSRIRFGKNILTNEIYTRNTNPL